MRLGFAVSILLFILITQFGWSQIPQTMSYQGVLTDASGTPVDDGTYDLTFSIYEVAAGGTSLWTETQSVTVVNSIFNVILGSINPLTPDFDNQYWLGVAVGTGPELTPRTQLASAAYSLNARSVADDAVTGDKIAHGQVVRSINGKRDDVTLAEGANITITPSGNTLTISSSFDGWRLTGNAGTTSADFLGTVDDRPLELRVNNAGALRLEPNITSPSIIGGYSGNSVTSGIHGAAISGGGESGKANSVTGHYGAIGGGAGNVASGAYATVPGGYLNEAQGSNSFAAGHKAKAHHDSCFVWGDSNNIDFVSTGPNQFLIRAAGGVGIGIADPTEELDVAGDIHASGTIQSGSSVTIDGANHRIDSNQALDIRVNSYRALRLEPNSTSPNAIGGYIGNSVNSGAYGASIGGGGSGSLENIVTDNHGTVGGGAGNQAGNADQVPDDADYATVGGGSGNTASGYSATAGGGVRNRSSGYIATIGGGLDNKASGSYAAIGGGHGNVASGYRATVGGGWGNTASAQSATIAGGGRSDPLDSSTGNRVTDEYGTVGGGGNNQAGDDAGATDDATYATIGGGDGNTASETYATIAGGKGNEASGRGATIGGGNSNEAGYYATVGGGLDNTANAQYATIAGGGRSDFADPSTGNRVTSDYGTIGGGGNNQAGEVNGSTIGADYATVSGGAGNTASGRNATIGGGWGNTAGSWCATIGGGEINEAGFYATVGGGGNNTASDYGTIGGGGNNTASGYYATIPGGVSNEARGSYSFAAGRRSVIDAAHDGAFLFADSHDQEFNSAAPNEFAVRCTGGARFVAEIDGSGNPTVWTELDTSTGEWIPNSGMISDRNLKTNFAPVDVYQVLERLASIPIETWNYKSQNPSIRHIGPMAQDFHSAFAFGRNDRRIEYVDADGVALAAIQGLYELLKEKEAQIATQEKQIAKLTKRLNALEAFIATDDQKQRD